VRKLAVDHDKRVADLLELVQLPGLGGRYPRQLSGGQRQRVALARALASNPKLLLLDEPFGALDAVVRKQLRAGLKEIVRSVGVTTIIVTHDQEEAFDLADQVGGGWGRLLVPGGGGGWCRAAGGGLQFDLADQVEGCGLAGGLVACSLVQELRPSLLGLLHQVSGMCPRNRVAGVLMWANQVRHRTRTRFEANARYSCPLPHPPALQPLTLVLPPQVVVFNRGLIEQQGSPASIITSPSTPFIMKFVGDTNVVPAGCLLVKRAKFVTDKESVMFRPTDIEVSCLGCCAVLGCDWLLVS
jgi:hypothetical protein